MSASDMTHMLKDLGNGSMYAGIGTVATTSYAAGWAAGFWVGVATGVGVLALLVGGYLVYQYYANQRKLAWVPA